MDKLCTCAYNFKNLAKSTKYEIHLGNKKMESRVIYIDFKYADFHHLAGLQYVERDNIILKGNRERIFKEILSKKINYSKICNSSYISIFNERSILINNLESFIDSYNSPIYQKTTNIIGSQIEADFIFVNKNKYYFTVKRNKYDEKEIYAGKSIFENHTLNYTHRQKRYSVLKLCKINKLTNDSTILYKNKNYHT